MLTLAVSLGLGSREVAHNLLAGIYAREQFKQGDIIQLNDVTGVVREVSTLSTIIVVDDNEEVSIPNSTLYNHVVKISS